MNKSREELIKELNKIIPCSCIDAYKLRKLTSPDCANCNYADDVADFILEDRKRICGPLLKIRGIFSNLGWIKLNQENLRQSIDETLKNAGLE